MITSYYAPVLSVGLTQLSKAVAANEEKGKRTVVFCEDRLTLAAERAVCDAVTGTFLTSVFTFSRFLSSERGKADNVLSGQGSAMAISRLIDKNRGALQLFGKLSSASAAQEVYDTIALLYSSRVSAEDIAGAKTDNVLLSRKLHDLALLYGEYSAYLKENGVIDRNAYLKQLPDIITASPQIKGAQVIFLGFQAFTSAVAECVEACMQTADGVCGIFIDGEESIYVHEAARSFAAIAKSVSGERVTPVILSSPLSPAAEFMRKNIFEPDSLVSARPYKLSANEVGVVCAADEQEEMEYVAAQIVKLVNGGVRYRSISVMLPDVERYQPVLERVFGEYGLPYYVDRRYSLSTHPICSFITSYLGCAADGCLPESVIKTVSSPLFTVKEKPNGFRREKDIFVNYTLRLANFRGGVRREPKAEILENLGFETEAVQKVRSLFLSGLALLPKGKAGGAGYCAALRKLLDAFSAKETLEKEVTDEQISRFPSVAAMSERAYDNVIAVLTEAEKLTCDAEFTPREFMRVLASGFSAARISLIPPKQDAVFVGDLAKTANTGSRAVFVAGLTDAVPCTSQDTAILTDGELTSLEKIELAVSPKISQVNRRVKEMTALNICAFTEQLRLIYPAASGGDESSPSEIISYACRLFETAAGKPISPVGAKDLPRLPSEIPYYCARPVPALKRLFESEEGAFASAIYAVLSENDGACTEIAREIIAGEERSFEIKSGERLYGNSLSPTALETYFSCPYKSFMRQGLRLAEREEGALRPLDTGNFIHSVLDKTAGALNSSESERQFRAHAEAVARGLLEQPAYSALSADKRGEYSAEKLVEEAAEVAAGMYRQVKNSNFSVAATELSCNVDLGGLKLYGRIDRVDECGHMVRIIDYKTGAIDSTPSSYYMGQKLQLPLYLLSASGGKRAVGAYYFPAGIEYADKAEGDFRLKGFMDGSEEVVKNTQPSLADKQKSDYVDAYLNARKVDGAMTAENFKAFLDYAVLVSKSGARELTEGNVAPSPSEGACKSCKFAGSCRYDVRESGERHPVKPTCSEIAEIVKRERGEK